MLEVLQILVFRDDRERARVFPALWAAFQEVDAFYNHDRERVRCRPLVVSPGTTSKAWSIHTIANSTIAGAVSEKLEVAHAALATGEQFWQAARGRFARTVDQDQLASMIRSGLPRELADHKLLIVTDQEITPPPDWRYVIWDRVTGGYVVSVAPTDPQYWSEPTSHRVAAIKHRVRTACLSIVGPLLGLPRCHNSSCFLFADVTSTDCLDFMVSLGDEHNLPALTGLGFSPRPRDPAAVQVLERARAGPEISSGVADSAPEWNTLE